MYDLQKLVNKIVPLRFRGADIRLQLSHALFSSFDVDAGSKLLLKILGKSMQEPRGPILDVGCGVGTLGLALAAAYPSQQVYASDVDYLACAYTEFNARLNKIHNIEVTQSLMCTGAYPEKFSTIVSNIPAKAGGPVIETFFAWANQQLEIGGELAIVIVTPLAELARKNLLTQSYTIVCEEKTKMHLAILAKKTSVTQLCKSFDFATLYKRSSARFYAGSESYSAEGFYGLDEFDSLSFSTLLAISTLDHYHEKKASPAIFNNCLIIEPGLGHLALYLQKKYKIKNLSISSRSLLSREALRHNLEKQSRGSTSLQSYSTPELAAAATEAALDISLCIIFWEEIPRYDGAGALLPLLQKILSPSGLVLIIATSQQIERLARVLTAQFSPLISRQKKGQKSLLLARTKV